MQHQNQTFLDFRLRTAKLAAKKQLQTKDLPGLMRVSRATFFACKKPNAAISDSVWAKLAEAEFLAGIETPEFEDHLRHISDAARVADSTPGTEEEKTALFDRLLADVSTIRTALERLEREIHAMQKPSAAPVTSATYPTKKQAQQQSQTQKPNP